MGAHGDNVLVIVGWAVGSFFLALLLVFGLFGGVLLGGLLVLLVLVLLPVVMIVAALQGKPASATAMDEQAVAESPAPGEQEALISTAHTPVFARVVRSQGTCPMKRVFWVGEAWTLNGKWSGAELCPRAEKLLTESATQLRSGEIEDGELCQCLGEGHGVVFQLRRGHRKEAVASVPEIVVKRGAAQ